MNASPATEAAIRVDGLSRRFGDLAAVDDLSFEVGRGALFGLVPLPPVFYLALAGMTLAYLALLEFVKHLYQAHLHRRQHRRSIPEHNRPDKKEPSSTAGTPSATVWTKLTVVHFRFA